MVDFDDGDYCKRCEGPWTAHWLSDPRSDRDGAVDFVVFCPDDVDVNKWDDDPDEWGVACVGARTGMTSSGGSPRRRRRLQPSGSSQTSRSGRGSM